MIKVNLFIVIASYNAKSWICKCLASIHGYPVILVDNNSTDGTVNFVKTHFPSVHVIEQKNNLGFGRANNIGISYALNNGAEFVFLMNQDVYLTEHCLDELVDIQKRNTQFGILSPLHLNGNGDKLDENFSNYISYPANSNLYSDSLLKKPLNEIYEVPFINAAAWLCSRKFLETVGGFDPIFFHYGEDENLCQRVLYHGFKIGVVPTSRILHDRGDNIKKKDFSNSMTTHLRIMERRWKMKYADVNSENINDFETLKHDRKLAIAKSLLKLKFKSSRFYMQELKLLNRITDQISDSIRTNRKSGPSYLNLK